MVVAMGERRGEKVRVDRVDGFGWSLFAWAAVHAKFGRQFHVLVFGSMIFVLTMLILDLLIFRARWR